MSGASEKGDGRKKREVATAGKRVIAEVLPSSGSSMLASYGDGRVVHRVCVSVELGAEGGRRVLGRSRADDVGVKWWDDPCR